LLAAFDHYRRLISVQVRSQMQYRISFLLEAFSTGMLNAVAFLTLALVLQKFENIAGWKLGEVAFLYGMVETSFGISDMVFSGFDPQHFGRHIRLGALDQILLRPVSVTLQVLGSEFVMRRLGRIVQGLVVLAIAFNLTDIAWSPGKVLYLPFIFLGLVAFFGGLFIVGATISIWTVESIEAINIFTYGGTEMMAYPMNIYPGWMVRFFTYIVPAIFLNYYPALYILGKPDPFHLPYFVHFIAPLAGLAILAASLAFWQFGLRHYQSTGT
jgi:ABC-2 type transport system permease protein